MTIVRRALMMVSVIAATALTLSPAAYADPTTSPSPSVSPTPTPTPKPTPTPTATPSREPCTTDEWTVATPANPVGMAYTPNAYAEDSARVTNKTSVDFPDTVFILGVDAGAGANTGPAPLVRWQVNGGAWHQFQLHVLALGTGLPHWGTDNVALPELRAKASYTVTIGMAFPPGTPGRNFNTQFLLGTVECGPANLGEDYSMSYGYYPITPTKSGGNGSGNVGTGGGSSDAVPHSAGPTSISPSAPAPEVSPVPTVDVAMATTSAPAPSSSLEALREAQSSGAVWVIVAAVLALAAICSVAYYRVRRRAADAD
jgi:hypothetical protein